MTKTDSKGFTVIEIAVVLLILGLFYMTFSPAMLKMADVAKTNTTVSQIEEIATGIDDYFKTNGKYPESLIEVFGEVPLDEWGNPYQYLNLVTYKSQGKGKMRKDKNLVPINSDYDLYSMGPDGKSVPPLTANASRDDIVRGRNGGFFGVATEY
jgi:general secretion pathway protein G